MGPIPGGRLKNLMDIDKWSSLSLCFQYGECQYFESCTVLVQSDGSHSSLSPLIHGEIVLSIKTNTTHLQFDPCTLMT